MLALHSDEAHFDQLVPMVSLLNNGGCPERISFERVRVQTNGNAVRKNEVAMCENALHRGLRQNCWAYFFYRVN